MTTDMQGHPLGDHRETPPVSLPVVSEEVSPLSTACGHHCGHVGGITDHCPGCHVGTCPETYR